MVTPLHFLRRSSLIPFQRPDTQKICKYTITDGERLELSDRWDEALQIKGWVENIWAELAAEELP